MGLRPGPKTNALRPSASLEPINAIQVSMNAAGRMIVHDRPLARSDRSAANLARCNGDPQDDHALHRVGAAAAPGARHVPLGPDGVAVDGHARHRRT
jgi:hypothetical protein